MTEETGSASADASAIQTGAFDVAALGGGGQIAGYRVEAEIGHGGMATVYRALDVKLGRRVALKILAPRLAEDDSFRKRFIHESHAAAAVDHPNIVPVFEAGESGGLLFIAMRYVGTGDVRTLLEREGRLPVDRAVAICAQVASALDAASTRGLVHRDVKPANMLLAESAEGRADHVYLSDFGLSKHSLAPSGLTATGQFMGTLDYVAPEQIEGRAVDGRADQYALACAAVEMLTGQPPFRRNENIALMWAQLSESPPSLRERRPELPEAIDRVISRALAKSPAERYPTCMDFAVALRAASAAEPPGPAGPAAA
ncbi:MAG: serine/threonine-protein kinase, partial [Streptosporangiaceae bacterium]